ncbi:50S ribosomal protein L21 [Deinococcus deserti]|uniref:Large ribosomal subunit protein bL21 n=1 Tax=Deinococcus deserti (strain DSM 17065 / CIP 109153 / LMG 22923 / VCD115) TaxID=546414 RepID=RL21_DEIDV|nr:50S ribosomal protein L21 [Deinococcus deserti]C1CZJ9.1 RecName: Full=Large ribosomal subunit protein bL21; AltName: Full=50S ribosomal protein L21 [Deinococcus deserti VCD115]ACO47247.1 putative 50S ribosomal protein L21 [Deinococcus deserti VCD115]
MFAIIQTGGKQYRVQEGDVIRVENLKGEAGDKLDLTPLFVGGDQALFGDAVSNFVVNAEVVEHGRGPKIYIRKYKSGVQYRRRTGHRQDYTAIKILGIKG